MNVGDGDIKGFWYEGAAADVSCLYGESTAIPYHNGQIYQTTFHAPPLPELRWFLVGKGVKGSECGESYAGFICDNPSCGKVHYVEYHCRRRACPECYHLWVHEEVDKVVARLLSRESLVRNRGKRLVHIVLSPDQDEKPATHEELRALFASGYEYIREKGAVGGTAIFHAFRATDEAKECARAAHSKTWAWIRAQDHSEAWYRYSPHLHLICFVNHMKEPERGEKWIYKTKVDKRGQVINLLRGSKHRNVEDNLRGLIGYLLTHAVTLEGEEDSFHSVRWFGSCSYNKFATTEEEVSLKDKPEKVCEECGSKLVGLWAWRSRWYWSVVYHDIDEPKYWYDIEKVMDEAIDKRFGAKGYG